MSKNSVSKESSSQESPKETDSIDVWMKALFEIRNPQHLHAANFSELQNEWIQKQYDEVGGKYSFGNWIDLRYKGHEYSVHLPSEDDYFDLLTTRNREVYTQHDLDIIRTSKVCILGQSIGGNVAEVAAHSGYGHIALADYDTLDPTNLNRVMYANALDVGSAKIDIVAEEMKMVNPYIKVDTFDKGINEENLDKYLDGAKVVLELIDDFKMKIRVREAARARGIPVLMTTNVGRWRIIDIERYDLESTLPLFNGLVNETVLKDILTEKLTSEDTNRYAREIVGVDNIDPRALQSLPLIGKRNGLAGRPQIASTVAANAGTAVFILSWILGCFDDLNQLTSGRKLLKEEELVSSNI